MIIDSHAHFVPQTLLEEIRDVISSFPSIKLVKFENSFGFSFSNSPSTRPVNIKLSDKSSRLSWMDNQLIDLQVVGGWLDMFGYQIPIDEGIKWSKLINKHLKSFCDTSNNRFIPLATLPMQNGKAAAQLLDEVHKDGFKGVMIGTQPKGIGGVLDDKSLIPFWESANRNKSIIFIHPMFDSGDNRVNDYGMNNAVGRITDTLIAISRIIFSGHVERYSDIKIVIGMGGACLPYILGRLIHNYNLNKDSLFNPKLAISNMYFDTVLHDKNALSFLIDTVGSERVMMGSDMPFPIGDNNPKDIIKKINIKEEKLILGKVASDLFSL